MKLNRKGSGGRSEFKCKTFTNVLYRGCAFSLSDGRKFKEWMMEEKIKVL